jgi:hypothetical protein
MTKLLPYLLVLTLGFTSCSAFQSGGSLNPVGLRPNSSLSVKAGSSTAFNVFVGSAPYSGLNPAALYRQHASQITMNGVNEIQAPVGLAQLSGTTMPLDWEFRISNDYVEVTASSLSTNNNNIIQTTTQVELGTYSINGNLTVPKNTAPGTYRIQARINVKFSNPVILEWTINVSGS